jgi:hypothetical protein
LVKLVVIEDCLTNIANTVFLFLELGKSVLCLGALIANTFATSVAVVLVAAKAEDARSELFTTKHAVGGRQHRDLLDVKQLG